MGEDTIAFAIKATAGLVQKLVNAINGGDVEAVRELSPVLPEGMAIEAEGRAIVAAQRRKAEVTP